LKYACWIKLVIEAQIALILSLSHQTLRFEFQEQRTAHLTFTDDQIHKEINFHKTIENEESKKLRPVYRLYLQVLWFISS
jgi:hypothetical protein